MFTLVWQRERERRFRVHKEAPGFRPGPRSLWDSLAIKGGQHLALRRGAGRGPARDGAHREPRLPARQPPGVLRAGAAPPHARPAVRQGGGGAGPGARGVLPHTRHVIPHLV